MAGPAAQPKQRERLVKGQQLQPQEKQPLPAGCCTAGGWAPTQQPSPNGVNPLPAGTVVQQASHNEGGTRGGSPSAGQSSAPAVKRDFPTSGVQTLMVRNIPVRYTQDMLLKEWPNRCTYDFLYLPICIDRKRNSSFCFINFVSEAFAIAFQSQWQRHRLDHFTARKPLDISPADVQGRDDNLLQVLRNKTFRIKNVHFLPVLFNGNRRVSIEEFLAGINWELKGMKLTKFQRDDQKPSGGFGGGLQDGAENGDAGFGGDFGGGFDDLDDGLDDEGQEPRLGGDLSGGAYGSNYSGDNYAGNCHGNASQDQLGQPVGGFADHRFMPQMLAGRPS